MLLSASLPMTIFIFKASKPTTMVLSAKDVFLSSKHHYLFPNGISGFLSTADLFWIQCCHGRVWVMVCSFAHTAVFCGEFLHRS